MITAPGYERLVTHVFKAGSQYLDYDAVFGVCSSLVEQCVTHENDIDPYDRKQQNAFAILSFNFVLNSSQRVTDYKFTQL